MTGYWSSGIWWVPSTCWVDTGGHIRPSSLPEGPIGVGEKMVEAKWFFFFRKIKHHLKLHFRNAQIPNGIKQKRICSTMESKTKIKSTKTWNWICSRHVLRSFPNCTMDGRFISLWRFGMLPHPKREGLNVGIPGPLKDPKHPSEVTVSGWKQHTNVYLHLYTLVG